MTREEKEKGEKVLKTDLANLGPSLSRTTDLGVGGGALGAQKKADSPNGRPEASSFDQILKTTSAEKASNSGRTKETQSPEKPAQAEKPTAVSRKTDRDVRDPQAAQAKRPVDSNRNEPRTAQQNKPRETENWDEPGSVQDKGTNEKVESANREQVMLEFMDSMESEFGIPPQRLVEAMTQIPTKDQLASPEDSASQVIAQLELPEDQEQKALALYVGMLAQLKGAQDPSFSKAQMATAAAATTAVTVPALMSNQQRRQVLNQSLDKMNSNFFMQGPNGLKADPQSLQGMNSQLPRTGQEQSLVTDAMPKDQVSFGKQAAQPEKLPPFMQDRSQVQTPDPKLEDLRAQMQAVAPDSQEGQALLKSLVALSASAAALDQGMRANPKNAQALEAEQILGQVSGDVAPAGAAAASGLAALGLSASGDDEEPDDWGQGSSDQQFMTSNPSMHQPTSTRTETAGSQGQFGSLMAAGGGAMGKELSGTENKANIQQLMNQAQYLIKKGGGEAKIQMAPEGIGQVHMKMTVLDGKVNLEMQAESKEAKKLIESSIGDLKTHLAHHQLTMDQVKVDVGNQTSTDSRGQDSQQQQQQMDGRQNQSKQQARDFWSEFSGQNGGFERRSGFNDSPGIRAYGGTKREAPLTPTSSGVAATKAYSGSGKGRGLDLVA
jgi:flagellar hook-length control protein FliK